GGLLVDLGSWRAVFWLNLPIIVAALVPIIVHHPASPRLVPGSGDAARETGRSESSHPSRIRLALACLVAGLLNFCVLGTLLLLARHLHDSRGLIPCQAALATLRAAAPLPFLGALSVTISNRLGVWRTSALGLIVAGVGLGLMGLTVYGSSLWGL